MSTKSKDKGRTRAARTRWDGDHAVADRAPCRVTLRTSTMTVTRPTGFDDDVGDLLQRRWSEPTTLVDASNVSTGVKRRCSSVPAVCPVHVETGGGGDGSG